MISTKRVDRFLTCPRSDHYYKTLAPKEFIPFTEYYEYVRRGMYIAGLKWVMLYRKEPKKTRPKLQSYLADYRNRAWRSRPSAVKRLPHEPFLSKFKEKLYAESAKILSLFQHRVTGAGNIIGVSLNYQLEQLGVYGKIDAVYQDPKHGIHLYKLTENVERDKYNDSIYLDVLGFKQIYGKPPDFIFLIDILTQRKISLTGFKQSGIMKSLKELVRDIDSGATYKTPGAHCSSCKYKDICDLRKRGNNGN